MHILQPILSASIFAAIFGHAVAETLPNGCPATDPVKRPALLPNPDDKQLFFMCLGGEKYPLSCSGGFVFHPSEQVCDWPEDDEADDNDNDNDDDDDDDDEGRTEPA